MKCEICEDRLFLVCDRDDGRRAVERCDACCCPAWTDRHAAEAAQMAGISCAGIYPHYLDHETRRDMIITHAWESWTRNGLRLDDDMICETIRSVQDAASSAYHHGIDDIAWLRATLARLNRQPQT